METTRKKLTAETKQKMSVSHTGLAQSEEMKQNRKNTWKLKMEKKLKQQLANARV